MPRDLDLLTAELEAMPLTDSKQEAAEGLAAAYANYAADAQSCQGAPPASLAAAEATLKTAMLAALQGIDPASTANAMALAYVAFWLAPPVVFGADGAVVATGPAPTLAAALVAAWAANVAGKLSKHDSCAAIAAVLHAWTSTVTVVHSGPGACSGPIA